MFHLTKVLLLVLLFTCSTLFADFEEGKRVFEKKCSSCHGGYISAKILKENFFEKNNEMLHLNVPTVNMLAYALKDSPLHLGDKEDPEMQKFEIVEFMKDYLYNPNLENSICDPIISKHYKKKESMKGEVSEDEIESIADYLFEYKKMRLKKHPKKYKVLSDSDDTSQFIKQAKEEGKVILVEVTSESCHFCKKMKKEVFSKDDVLKAIDKDFIFIVVDVDKTKLPFDLQKSYQKITPSFFTISSDEVLMNSYPGAWTKEDFLEILKENIK